MVGSLSCVLYGKLLVTPYPFSDGLKRVNVLYDNHISLFPFKKSKSSVFSELLLNHPFLSF